MEKNEKRTKGKTNAMLRTAQEQNKKKGRVCSINHRRTPFSAPSLTFTSFFSVRFSRAWWIEKSTQI